VISYWKFWFHQIQARFTWLKLRFPFKSDYKSLLYILPFYGTEIFWNATAKGAVSPLWDSLFPSLKSPGEKLPGERPKLMH